MGSPYQTVAFYTLGCKLNYAETSTIERSFIESGYSIVSYENSADVYVINSCSVTENSDKRARKIVRHMLRNAPYAQIVIIGCYAQLKPDEIAKIPGIALVVGTEEKFNLPKHLDRIRSGDKSKIITSNIKDVHAFNPSYSFGKRTRSYLKIQDGCDYNCSFCTIPLSRGKSRSSTNLEVIMEAERIVAEGGLEIVLTGVNIGDFGDSNNQNYLIF